MTITNNTEVTFTPNAQQSIRNAMANCGVDDVEAVFGRNKSNAENVFDLYSNDEYQFSVDIEDDNNIVIYSR